MDIGSRWGIALLLACSATKTVLADDMYRPREREAYPPDVYCRWNRTGLPFKQQEICAERDRRYGVYEHKWQKLVSVNGAVYLVDLNSVVHNPDTSYLLVYEKQGEDNLV